MWRKSLGFTLTELIIVMIIAAMLATFGISGYMDSLRIERRKDAILALKKASLIINDFQNNPNQNNSNPICSTINNVKQPYDAVSNNCSSEGGFYVINYNPNGFQVNNAINNNLLTNEVVYLRATAKGIQEKDNKNNVNCTIIYLTNLNNLYPLDCVN